MKEMFSAYLAKTLGIDDPDIQAELIAEYRRTFMETVGQMKLAEQASDFERLRRLGHTLKGCALNIGHAEAREYSLGLENCAKENDLAGCGAEIEKLSALAAELE